MRGSSNTTKLHWLSRLGLVLLSLYAPTQAYAQYNTDRGILDLRQVVFPEGEPKTIHGDFRFFWDTLMAPELAANLPTQTYHNVAGAWEDITLPDGSKTPYNGFATYHLQVLQNTNRYPEGLAIKLSTIRQAYRLYIDGELVVSSGRPDRHDFHTKISAPQVSLPVKDTLDLVFHVGNENFFSSGMVSAIRIAPEEQIDRYTDRWRLTDLLLMGSILIIGLYHIIIFFILNGNRPAVYFGAICLFLGLRVGFTGEHLLTEFFPNIPAWFSLRIEFGAIYFSPLFMALFFRELFPGEVPKWLIRVAIAVSSFLLLTILWPSEYWYGNMLLFGQLYILVCGPILIFYCVLVAAIRKRRGALGFFIAFILFFLTCINDILVAMNTIETPPLVPIGLILLVVAQSWTLAGRFAGAFKDVEDLGKNLEKKVDDRTAELAMKTDQLQLQKAEILKKHENLRSSLQYAQRIQKSILGQEEILMRVFPRSFLFFRPRDLVSGNFYWAGEVGNKQIIAVGDSLEQGVPGAFMTVMVNSQLNTIVLEEQQDTPTQILKRMNERLGQALEGGSGTYSTMGINMAVLVIDQESKTAQFAGAGLGMGTVLAGEWTEVTGEPITIGDSDLEALSELKDISWSYTPKEVFYLFTNGIVNQPGGKRSPVYGQERLTRFLKTSLREGFSQQRDLLLEEFEAWKGEGPQSDDVLLVGIQMN
ncbi:MAG TPA: hypothetical protein DCR93_36320 [Cytophagales bacterium]|nr:hypothetical protein [Cytophagales bacterium]HAP64724.1 hypothetical protein [Cytophagales bacterium]